MNAPIYGAGKMEVCKRCLTQINIAAQVREQVHEFIGREIDHLELVASNITDHDALVVIMDLRGRLLAERAKLFNDAIDAQPPIYEGGGNA